MMPPPGKFLCHMPAEGKMVSIYEHNPGDGGRHVFHVVLHRDDVVLTEQPLRFRPFPGDIRLMVLRHEPEPSPEVRALQAAIRHACDELEAIAVEAPGGIRRQLHRLRKMLTAELPENS